MAPMILDQDVDKSEAQSNLPTGTTKKEQTSFRPRSRSCFPSTAPDELHDLIIVGCGPAGLAIAIALHDKFQGYKSCLRRPKVKFLERQPHFAWHAGMMLPEAKMQISFIKDLATLRDPCSKFTFLNYLKEHSRLVQFSNLGTFLPSRLEFEDYMRWCASHFIDVVEYGQQVLKVSPSKCNEKEKSDYLIIEIRDKETGERSIRKTRNVVIAVGGTPQIPSIFSGSAARVIHSSEYGHKIPQLLPIREKPYHIAVIGSGQSGAEVFNDLQTRFPNASTKLIIRDTALRPSDDSPFVNEIFDPEAVSTFYSQPAANRASFLSSNRNTNYSVVRPELLNRIHETIYQQSIKQPEKSSQQHQILPSREIVEVVDQSTNNQINLKLKVMDAASTKSNEVLVFDAIILATGYTRHAHVQMLKDAQVLSGSRDGSWQVGRDYKLKLNPELASEEIGIWLQGCNESTHGLSDSLLSILATRSGELVDSIFGAWER
jgi:L-ornithine N5-monooxygenase